MAVGIADIHKAVQTRWTADGLDATFRALWPVGTDATQFPVLHDTEATPDNPRPYCVFTIEASNTRHRMSHDKANIREVRQALLVFEVYAGVVDGDARSAKQIAAYLGEEVMKKFGGHPDPAEVPEPLVLDNGNFLQSQFQGDQIIRDGDDDFHYRLPYVLLVDVVSAVTNVV